MLFLNAIAILLSVGLVQGQAPSYAPYPATCPTSLITRTGSFTDNNQTLPAGESTYIQNRRTTVLPTQWTSYLNDASTGTTGYNVTTFASGWPRMGLAISGGGFRASLYGVGTLSALYSASSRQTVGPIVDLADYLAGLSGGSWAVTSFSMNDMPDPYGLVLGAASSGNETGWELDMDLLAPGGILSVSDNTDYYDDMLEDVRIKGAAGYPISIIDIWGRALSYHMFNQTNEANFYDNGPHDQGLLFSSIKYTQNFQAGKMPLPLVVSTSRVSAEMQNNNTAAGDTTIIPLENTQFEFTPYAMGSFDPTLQAHVPMEFAGTYLDNGVPRNSSACINGYENAGFVIGTSAALFNAAEEVVSDTDIIDLITRLAGDLTDIEGSNSSIPLVANWPNSFRNFAPSNASFKFESSGNDILQLTDGGENGENVPLSPLLVRARGLDILLAIDSSADTTYSWPNGTSLLATRDRVAVYPENVVAFPPMPNNQSDFVSQGLNTRPVFFGCNTTTNGNASSAGYYPILVYLPNAPPPIVNSSTYLTNTSTFKLNYDRADSQSFLDAANANGLKGFQNSTSQKDDNWPLCLKCAIMERARKRAVVPRSAACQTCFTQYCWSDNVAEVLTNYTGANPPSTTTNTGTSAAVGGAVPSLILSMVAGVAVAASALFM